MTPDKQAPKLVETQSQAEQKGPEGNFSNIQMEIKRLEEDLKYMTGRGDRQEALDKIEALKKSITEKDNKESKMIQAENEKNFEAGMSFNVYQINAINYLKSLTEAEYIRNTLKSEEVNILYFNREVYKSDLEVKKVIDAFIAEYRSKRNNFSESGYNANYTELDNAVLGYEKAFGVNNGPLVNMDLKKERLLSANYVSINTTHMQLESLRRRLLDAKANAKVTILAGKDMTEIIATEKELVNKKREMAIAVSHAIGDYIGINLDVSDFGAN